ncbi:DUF58 domain-containing protein [Halobacteria archaeon AArc-dxtr1]|nr:DUF58 domain-containing protein [Halobacteria archaeon AArc-dxtr1]
MSGHDADDGGERGQDPVTERTAGAEWTDSTAEWSVAAAVGLAGVGLAAGSQLLVIAATIPLWYAVAAALGDREPAAVRIEREVAVGDPANSADRWTADELATDPGDTVAVRTTVTNAGSEPIVDLRVVDGVPDELPVVSGTPRACVALEPLETATIEYELALRRGEHAFDEARVRARDTTGTVAETVSVPADGADTISCAPPVGTVGLAGATNDYAGEVPTDEGGSGVEFYAVRDYDPGDPVSAIDWRRYGRTRDLATVEYRAERSTRIVCLVDARPSQFGAATTADPPAAELSAGAAERTIDSLVDSGHPTGFVGIYDGDLEVVPPGTDPATRERVARALETTLEPGRRIQLYTRSWPNGLAPEVAETLPGEAQVFLFSAFVDDEPVSLVAGLRARGYAVRVVSPDVTVGEDPATRLEALDRDARLARARAAGARVVDWDLARPLGIVLRDAVGEVRSR